MENKNKLRIVSIIILVAFIFGILFLVWTTISKDTSLSNSSADVKYTVCGNIDTNKNGILDIVDYNELRNLLGKGCLDTPVKTFCGPKDVNSDHIINLKDIAEFGKRFNRRNCGF